MEVKLMNFCRIRDENGNVVVLDKVKKVGWEGLTFPGGKVQGHESLYAACLREVKEETGLMVEDLKYCGTLTWVFHHREDRELVFLFDTCKFSGELLESTHEGKVFWMKEEDFLKAEGKADYFDTYYRVIAEEKVKEAICVYHENKTAEISFICSSL